MIELCIWKICDNCIENFLVHTPDIEKSYSSSEIRELDFEARVKSGFTYAWLDNELHYVQICESADLQSLANLLDIDHNEIKVSTVNVTDDHWFHLIPRLVYRSIGEAATRSPATVLLKGKNNEIFFPTFKMNRDSEGVLHGLKFNVYRINGTGLSLAVDYISRQPDDNYEGRRNLISSSERATMIRVLVDRFVPADGLPFSFGGNNFLFPNKPTILELARDDL